MRQRGYIPHMSLYSFGNDLLIGDKICASITHIWYDLCNIKKKKLSNLTPIDVKTLIIDLTSILSLILGLQDEKNDKCKRYYQPRK